LLAVAELPVLIRLIYDLTAERKTPGTGYAWYVTVALQRLAGVPPHEQRQRRAQLRIVPARPAPEVNLPALIADLARKKAL
jgi:hypothetical protein